MSKGMFQGLGTYLLSWIFVPQRDPLHVLLFCVGTGILLAGIDMRRHEPVR